MMKLLPIVLLVFPALVFAQTNGDYQTRASGAWDGASVWQIRQSNAWVDTAIPPSNADGVITILSSHTLSIPGGLTVNADQLVIASGASLIVADNGSLNITGSGLPQYNGLDVSGTLHKIERLSGGTFHITGTTPLNTVIRNGGIYNHAYTNIEGRVPLATWETTSTLLISGYQAYIAFTSAGNWSQSFGNVTYACPLQGNPVVAEGLLTTINNDFTIQNTGSSIFQLASSQSATINITGKFTISGFSAVVFSISSPNMRINCNSFDFLVSTNIILTEFTTSGLCEVYVNQDFTMTSGATDKGIRFATAGTGIGRLLVGRNFTFNSGLLDESGATTTGEIVFNGGGPVQTYSRGLTTAVTNTVNFVVASNSVVDMGTSFINGAGSLTVNSGGDLRVGSVNGNGTNANGSVQNGPNGNIRVTGTRNFLAGSILTYNAASAQQIGPANPSAAGSKTVIKNASGVNTVLAAVSTGDLEIQTGSLTASSADLTVNGNVVLQPGSGDIIVSSLSSTSRLLTLNGTLTPNDRVISFLGTASDLAIGGTGVIASFPFSGFRNLSVNRASGSINLTTPNLTFTGLTVSAGTASFTNTSTTLTTITLSGTGIADFNGTATANGLVTLNGGTLAFEGQTLNLRNKLTSAGGFLSSDNTSTLNILNTGVLGTLAFSPTGNTLGTLTLNRLSAGTLVTLNSPLTITSGFNLTLGSFLNSSGLTFSNSPVATLSRTLLGSFAAGSVAPAGGPYNLSYSGAPLTTGIEAQGSVRDLSTTNSGLTMGSNITLTRNFNLTSGTFSASTFILTLAGNFSNAGTFNANTGTVAFNGTTTLSGTTAVNFANLTINPSSQLIPEATLRLTGNFTNNGTFTAGTGTVQFLGTPLISQIVSGTATTDFFNISVTNTTANPDVTINTPQNLLGTLTLAASAVFETDGAPVGAGGPGSFTLRSTNDSPVADGRIATLPAGAVVSGNVIVQRFMSGEGFIFRYITPTVGNANLGQWRDDFPVWSPNISDPISGSFCGKTIAPLKGNVLFYNESTNYHQVGEDPSYVRYPTTPSGPSSGVPLVTGRGYAVSVMNYSGNCSNPITIDMTGPIVSGDFDYVSNGLVTFTNNSGDAENGYNLIGNPYPSAIDWKNPLGWTARTNISSVAAVLDNGSVPGSLQYVYLDNTAGGSQTIATGQAYYVRATSAGMGLILSETAKSGSSAIFYREGAPDNLVINVAGAGLYDKAILKLHPSASLLLDPFDGPKLTNSTINLSTVSTDNIPMAINSVNAISCGESIKLRTSGFVAGNYQLTFNQNGALSNYKVMLSDSYAGTTQDVTGLPSYSFNVTDSEGSKAPDRFSLVFEESVIDLKVNVSSKSPECNDPASRSYVEVANSQAGVGYYLMLGEKVVSQRLTGTGGSLHLDVDPNLLAIGNNEVSVKAVGTCSEYTLATRASILRDKMYTVSATSEQHCGPGSVSIIATGAPSNGSYRLYTTLDGSQPLAEQSGGKFVTPHLIKSKTYFVSAVNSLGCEGERVSVSAKIVGFDNAEIIMLPDNILKSNSPTGNQWFKDGAPVQGATQQEFKADTDGLYKLETNVSGCVTTAETSLMMGTKDSNSITDRFQYSPNPVVSTMRLQFTSDSPIEVSVLSSMGSYISKVGMKQEGDKHTGEFDFSPQPAGMYFIRVVEGGGTLKTSSYKVIKN